MSSVSKERDILSSSATSSQLLPHVRGVGTSPISSKSDTQLHHQQHGRKTPRQSKSAFDTTRIPPVVSQHVRYMYVYLIPTGYDVRALSCSASIVAHNLILELTASHNHDSRK